MSWDLGWNAQSALMPEKKVQIKVGDKGNDMIKAAMLHIQQKIKDKKQVKAAYDKPVVISQSRKNKGVEQRIRKDQQAHEMITMKNDKSLSVIKQKLEKKAKVYKESEKNVQNHSQFLVDFVQKELSKQDEEFQELKKQFYEGRLKEVMVQQQKIHEEEQKVSSVNDYMRENLAWERQVLQELNGQLTLSTDRTRVAQSFDKKLTEDEKQALNKVIQERIRQKQRMQELKRQQEEEQTQRIRKLKKLDILSSSDEQENADKPK